jgi:hypothetical protein
VQIFLGTVNYYRRYINLLADIAKPLYDNIKFEDEELNKLPNKEKIRLILTKKDENKFSLSPAALEAYNKLVKILCSYPILRQPVWNRLFTIQCDASIYAIGAILSQKDDDGHEYVVAYASRMLKGAELNMSINSKEMLAIWWSCKVFFPYIDSRPFDIVTDHQSLTSLLNTKDISGRMARMAIELQGLQIRQVHHRAGLLHSNVDMLSRPPLDEKHTAIVCRVIEEKRDDDNSSQKQLCPYEDQALITFLRFGKHANGASFKQVKRVERLAPVYRLAKCLDKDQFYLEVLRENKYLNYPRKEDRIDIIKKYHLLGHFKSETTLERVKEKYFWKAMAEDVKNTVDKCENCHQNSVVAQIHHPAKALEILKLGDRVAVDLSFGFEPSVEGYTGIFVAIEYLSNMVYIECIKSKNMNEIASCLLKYISIFGPPRVLLSDAGTEWCNSLISSLLNLTGVEKLTTSPYHPQCNGKVEKVIFTIGQMVRKHVGDLKSEWPKYIPWIVYSLNTRKHSTSGYRADELLFGRPHNEFINSEKVQFDCDQKNCFLERARELQETWDKKVPNAIENIKKSQVWQKNAQDKRHTVVTEKIPIGTNVYIKIEGIMNKLHKKFIGPYKIIGYSEYDKYILANVLGEALERSFRRECLKVVDLEETTKEGTYYQVKKILNHRKNKDSSFEYLVCWDENNTIADSWEPRENFPDPSVIEQYWNKNKKNQNNEKISTETTVKRGPGRPKKLANINLSLCLSLYLIFLILPLICARPKAKKNIQFLNKATKSNSSYKFFTNDTIYDNFFFCEEISNNYATVPFVDLNKDCEIEKSKEVKPTEWQESKEAMAKGVYILTRLSHEVNGQGVECVVKVTEQKCSISWLGNKEPCSYTTEYKDLDRNACLMMSINKNCGENQMTCKDNSCYYDGEPKPRWQWPFETVDVGTTCTVVPKMVQARKLNDTLFSRICYASDLFCKTATSIISWEKDVIIECPYHVIDKSRTLTTNGYDLLTDSNKNQIFSVKDRIYDCKVNVFNLKLYTTEEGVYLTTDTRAHDLKNSEMNTANMMNLLLTEIDGITFRSQENMRLSLKETCKALFSFLRIISHRDETFVRWHDPYNNLMILYVKQNLIFFPKCSRLSEVKLSKTETKCWQDLPIIFGKNNTAFLAQDNIIRTTSKEVECKTEERIFHLSIPNIMLLYSDLNTYRYVEPQHLLSPRAFFKSINKVHFIHYPDLVNETSFEKVVNQKNAKEVEEMFKGDKKIRFNIKNDSNVFNTPNIDFLHSAFVNFKQWTTSIIHLFTIFMVVILCTLIFIYLKPYRCLRMIRINRFFRRRQPDELALNDINNINNTNQNTLVIEQPTQTVDPSVLLNDYESSINDADTSVFDRLALKENSNKSN